MNIMHKARPFEKMGNTSGAARPWGQPNGNAVASTMGYCCASQPAGQAEGDSSCSILVRIWSIGNGLPMKPPKWRIVAK